ncbi:MAG: NAD(P)-dependent oxidoreductase [Flavobacterium sp.]|nr:NAD(P)-dependent oxidoreductase [Flavobacterium sp.]
MKKTILISGIKGFLASNLLNLLKEKYTLYGIGKQEENWNGITVFSSEKINQIDIVPDYLILCHASISSGQDNASIDALFHVNVEITKQLVEKFTSSAIIYISSASIYDVNSTIITEEAPVQPQSDYAISKLWAEKIVLKTNQSVVIRLSSVYGIGMKENTIIPNYINQALNNGEIQVWGNGERLQNYIHVDDVALCIALTIENFETVIGKILLAVNTTEYSNVYLAEIIADATNARVVFVNEDHSKSLRYDNNETRKLLNWSSKTNFSEAIYTYIKWKKEQF